MLTSFSEEWLSSRNIITEKWFTVEGLVEAINVALVDELDDGLTAFRGPAMGRLQNG